MPCSCGARAGRSFLLVLLTLAAACAPAPRPAGAPPAAAAAAESVYYPAPGAWQSRAPEEEGMRAEALQAAIAFAQAHETPWRIDVRAELKSGLARGPFGQIVGPVRNRGAPAGLVVRHGYIVAEWGDSRRVDMTFSVSKSFLSAVAGLAVDSGRIGDLDDRVAAAVPGPLFAGRRGGRITWEMLLRQTSEWEGWLWGKPDVADRREGRLRQLHRPGRFWEYNDVRVNLTAYALMRVWDRPLPEVLEAGIMAPIGASDGWHWHGYRNSYVTLHGLRMQSVSGGGHWGGGMWISSRDLARFGLLYLRRGRWAGRQLLPESWIERTTTPTPIKPTYGLMWWLNTGRALYPSAPASSFFALGAGANLVWVDPEHDLVVVARWIDGREVDGLIQRVLAAVAGEGSGTVAAAPRPFVVQ